MKLDNEKIQNLRTVKGIISEKCPNTLNSKIEFSPCRQNQLT